MESLREGPPASAATAALTHGGRAVDPSGLPECIRSYFEALNAENWEQLERVWAETAEIRAVGARPRHGRDEIMAFYRELFGPWTAHEDRPTRAVVTDEIVVSEVEFRGVTQAGKALTFDAVDVFDVADGSIVRLTTWYDLSWVRRQL